MLGSVVLMGLYVGVRTGLHLAALFHTLLGLKEFIHFRKFVLTDTAIASGRLGVTEVLALVRIAREGSSLCLEVEESLKDSSSHFLVV